MLIFEAQNEVYYTSPRLCTGDVFQDPLGMPETTGSTEPYIYYIFLQVPTYGKV